MVFLHMLSGIACICGAPRTAGSVHSAPPKDSGVCLKYVRIQMSFYAATFDHGI